MDRYAVAGNPVEHSQSPLIHAAFASALGESMVYERLLCPLNAFATTMRRFEATGARGGNVTVPFKFEAFDLAHRRTARAQLAGACNTLRFDAEGWLGDNTDGVGLVFDIEHNAGVVIAGLRVLLVGAGGAASGVLGPLVEARPREIVVVNRGVERARALVGRHSALARGDGAQTPVALSARAIGDAGDAFDVVINATSSSLAGHASPVPIRVLRTGTLAIDLMYGAMAVPFLHWATEHGAVARDGLGMLVEQAAESFHLFRGRRPETASVLAALRARSKGAGPATPPPDASAATR